MNHDIIATALCGRYVRLADGAGYMESNLLFPEDGTLLGAYILDAGHDRVRVTDDGETTFTAAVAGADITKDRVKKYQAIAKKSGAVLNDDGVMNMECDVSALPYRLAGFLQAASQIAELSVKHRPDDNERFERTIGVILTKQFGGRLARKVKMIGISGHQLQFPFAVDIQHKRPTLIQPVAATAGKVTWTTVYGTGGKFKDILTARPGIRLAAVIEEASDAEQASNYFADMADVYIYRGGDLPIAAYAQ